MTWNKNDAEKAINEFFDDHLESEETLIMPEQGAKVYELYSLSKLLQWIKKRYDVKIRLSPPSSQTRKQEISFKSGVGPINKRKFSYFIISDNTSDLLEVHTDIQVSIMNLSQPNGCVDSRSTNEIDIVVVRANAKDGFPVDPNNLILGIECKLREVGEIKSNTIKEVVGIRNEISYRTYTDNESEIDRILKTLPTKKRRTVRMKPHSEYWLAQIGENAKMYKERLKQAEIVLRMWRP